MNDPELVGFTCPNCRKVILLTLSSAKVYCGVCRQWANKVKPNLQYGSTMNYYGNNRGEKRPRVVEKS